MQNRNPSLFVTFGKLIQTSDKTEPTILKWLLRSIADTTQVFFCGLAVGKKIKKIRRTAKNAYNKSSPEIRSVPSLFLVITERISQSSLLYFSVFVVERAPSC